MAEPAAASPGSVHTAARPAGRAGAGTRDVRAAADASLPEARPEAGFDPVRFWVLASVRQLQALRGELVAALTADGGQGAATREVSVASAMALVASELATNALEHGTPPTTARLSVRGDTYLLDVADRELGTPPVVAGTRPAGDGGFGLMIAQRLAQDVGWYTTEQTKHVWATFSRSQQA